MASALNWLDVSAEQQRRVRDIIRMFEEPGTRDELVRSTLGVQQTVRIDAEAPIGPALSERLARIGAKVDGRTVLLLADDPPRQIRELLEAFHAGGAVVRDLTLKRASLEMLEPRYSPMVAAPLAWSDVTAGEQMGDVMLAQYGSGRRSLDPKIADDELDKFQVEWKAS